MTRWNILFIFRTRRSISFSSLFGVAACLFIYIPSVDFIQEYCGFLSKTETVIAVAIIPAINTGGACA